MTLTRKRRKAAAKNGSPKKTAGASPNGLPPDASPGPTENGLLSKRKIWIAASLAAMVVAAIGLGLYLLNGSETAWNARSASVATFVGSDTCAGCHRAEAERWHASQHAHAMDHATDKSVLGNFDDASFDYYGVH